MDINLLINKMLEEKYDNEYIDICSKYAKNLEKNNLPIIFDVKHFQMLIGLEEWYFKQILNNIFPIYREIKIKKKHGGEREIVVPIDGLKHIQRWILKNVLENIPISEFTMGFRKGYSIADNARMHINRECLMNLDLKDFFPTIQFIQVYRVFRYYGYTKELSKVFSKLCTHNGVLPQGAPTSPYLSNIICKNMDKRLATLFRNLDANYSRYADDITISGANEITNYMNLVIKIIEDEGFTINTNKTRIRYSNQRQTVTGLIVNKKLSVSKELEYKLKKHIYFCDKYGVNGHLEHENLQNKLNFKEYLYGIAYFIKMIDEDKGSEYLGDLDNIEWDY